MRILLLIVISTCVLLGCADPPFDTKNEEVIEAKKTPLQFDPVGSDSIQVSQGHYKDKIRFISTKQLPVTGVIREYNSGKEISRQKFGITEDISVMINPQLVRGAYLIELLDTTGVIFRSKFLWKGIGITDSPGGHQSSPNTQNPIPYLENDSFATNPFSKRITIHNIEAEYGGSFELIKNPVTNTHSESVIDTIFNFIGSNTFIEIYKAESNEILKSVKISSGEIKLKRNIEVGMSKADFDLKFDTIIDSDIIQIGNLEQTAVLTFYFAEKKLNSIHYKGYVN